MKRILLLGVAALLVACAPTMTAAPPGRLQAQPGLSVNLQRGWTHIPEGLNFATNGVVLTRHGVMLNRVDLMSIEEGRPLIRAAQGVDAPVFRASMSQPELVELTTASLTRLGLTDVTAENIRPQDFSGAPGIRFNLAGKYPSGLNFRGDAGLAVANGKLNVILFVAPALHYYDANAAEVDQMMASATVN